MTNHFRRILRVLAMACVVACGGSEATEPGTPVPKSVTMSVSTVAFSSLGETRQITATALDGDGKPISTPVTWSSVDVAVASVSSSGLVKSVGNGTTLVEASVGAFKSGVTVTVSQTVATLSVSPGSHTFASLGETRQLSAAVLDAGGTPIAGLAATSWTSEQPGVATVTTDGVVTAVSKGTATIKAHYAALTGSATIEVGGVVDLGVGWVHRSPEIAFVFGSTNPTRDGWPTVGQVVTWEAMVKNWSSFDETGVPYRWMADGVEIATGVVNIPAGAYAKVSLNRTWSFARTRLTFDLDHTNVVRETEERNNTLEVFTDAISAGLYVEQTVYDYFALHQRKLGIGSNSYEDWVQRQVRTWNQMFANARFPLTPNGVLDRIRLDKITIVPDGALPLAGGLPSNHPNVNDRTVDLQWGFPVVALERFQDHTTIPGANGEPFNAFFYDGALIHELSHARYLIDVYGFNVKDGAWTPAGIINKGSNIAILEGGQLVAGSVHMPIVAFEHVFYTTMQGLMNSTYHYVDEYSAAALNRIAGRRAVAGNTNAPNNLGVFLQDLPAQNRLTVRNTAGQALAGASVKLYQAAPKSSEWYGKYFDDTPDIILASDAQGRVLLGRNPFGGGSIVHWFGHSNATLIIRVEHQGKIGYGFLEAWRFNMAYWQGNTAIADHVISVTLR